MTTYDLEGTVLRLPPGMSDIEASRASDLAASLGARYVPAQKSWVFRRPSAKRWRILFDAGFWVRPHWLHRWVYIRMGIDRAAMPLIVALRAARASTRKTA